LKGKTGAFGEEGITLHKLIFASKEDVRKIIRTLKFPFYKNPASNNSDQSIFVLPLFFAVIPFS
jgi:hypothetical protein